MPAEVTLTRSETNEAGEPLPRLLLTLGPGAPWDRDGLIETLRHGEPAIEVVHHHDEVSVAFSAHLLQGNEGDLVEERVRGLLAGQPRPPWPRWRMTDGDGTALIPMGLLWIPPPSESRTHKGGSGTLWVSLWVSLPPPRRGLPAAVRPGPMRAAIPQEPTRRPAPSWHGQGVRVRTCANGTRGPRCRDRVPGGPMACRKNQRAPLVDCRRR